MSIKKICDGLKRYYESLDAEYDALFTDYCDENGFDSDAVVDEFGTDATDNMLVDFDDDFPFTKPPENPSERAQAILDLIQKIHNNPSISFDVKMPSFDKSLFEISDEDIEEVKRIYKKQCPVLYNSGMENDLTFLRILAIGRKNRIDYLQHLVDDYFCARIDNIDQSFTEDNWSSKHNHFRRLKKITGVTKSKDLDDKKIPTEPAEIAVSAVKAFGARCCPKLLLTPMIEINDSLEIIIKYIHGMVHFIRNLTNDKFKDTAICPFQVDLCIASGAPKDRDNKVSINTNDNDNKNGGGDNGDDDDDDDDDQTYIDCIGNIKEKLEKNKLNYFNDIFKTDIDQDIKARRFGEMFNSFVKKLSENKNQYPHNRRFITFVDRRKKDEEKYDGDTTWMYEPPNNCRNIPNDVVPEWYINAPRTCLLPNMEYDEKSSEIAEQASTNPNATKEQLLNSNIGSSFHCKGSLLTISFIVRELDAISMYLYWNGQIIRLRPKDIKPVLMNIFNMQWNQNSNDLYVNNNKEIDTLIEEIQQKVTDKYYESFCSSYTK